MVTRNFGLEAPPELIPEMTVEVAKQTPDQAPEQQLLQARPPNNSRCRRPAPQPSVTARPHAAPSPPMARRRG
jgi:hypothetical protein